LILSQEKMLPAKSIVVRLRREDVTHHQARPVILREHRGEVQLQFVVQVPAQLLAHTSGLEPRSVVEVVQRNIVLIQPLVVDLVLRLHETLHRALEVPVVQGLVHEDLVVPDEDRKSTRLNSSHVKSSYAVFCLKKKKLTKTNTVSTT